MTKNILVTGGSGFIGSHLVDELKKKNYKVTVVDFKKPQRRDVKFLKGNTLNFNFLKRITKNIDIIFHLAGVSDITKVKKIPIKTIKSHILSCSYLLEASRINSVKRILFASSIYAHSKKGNLYTSSKLASENIIDNYNLLYGINFTVLRYSTAYGERSRGVDVISIFAKNALKHSDIIINGNGKQTRNFIHVKDIAKGSVLALSNRYKNKTLNIGSNKKTKIIDLAKKIIKLSKSKSKLVIKKNKKRIDDFDLNKIPNKSLKNLLRFKMHYNLDKGIKRYLESLKN